MVGDSLKQPPFSPSKKRDSAAATATATAAAASSFAASFSYCMQGWHFSRSIPPSAMALPLPSTPNRKGIEKGEKPGRKNSGKTGESIRILITVTVLGSAGPIRFVVREDELVSSVIGTALKTYAREGRLPVLGSDLDCFVLYPAFDGRCALSPREPIGSFGSRNFLLCMKQRQASENPATPGREIRKKGMGGWKAWLNRSLGLISSD